MKVKKMLYLGPSKISVVPTHIPAHSVCSKITFTCFDNKDDFTVNINADDTKGNN